MLLDVVLDAQCPCPRHVGLGPFAEEVVVVGVEVPFAAAVVVAVQNKLLD